MGLIAKKENNVDFEPIPEGIHNAICYSIVDLGNQYNETYDKYSHKVCITWELTDQRINIEKDGQAYNLPRAISVQETLSLGEKANLYKLLISWRGRNFTDKELEGFDLKKILGVGCQIQVLHNVTKKNNKTKTYANVANVLPLPQGTKANKPENPLCCYEMPLNEQGRLVTSTEIPDEVPEWLQKKIQASREFIETAELGNMEQTATKQNAQNAVDNADDDIPF